MAVDVPVTIWSPTDGNGEFSNETPRNIVDTASDNLVDTSGNQIVDTGVVFSGVPVTIWAEDDNA